MVGKRLIDLTTPQPPDPPDQEPDFVMHAGLGGCHEKLDSIIIISFQLYRLEYIYGVARTQAVLVEL